jgi:hypothetical protein
VICTPSKLSAIRKPATFARMLSTHDLSCEENTTRWKWKCPRSICVSWTLEKKKPRGSDWRSYGPLS